ncbi:hypothetical protein SGRA_2467 [Saprospira grandis str. Lewin]|uniref:Uncharacterized protein n=1 Tax=Saprospira grandis (strain Lewin) TaxID=984262 RepID=H6L5H9_SAPGL|nr:hypothetical protein SGRA_2467 [Saprospira grandis str. Lewin]
MKFRTSLKQYNYCITTVNYSIKAVQARHSNSKRVEPKTKEEKWEIKRGETGARTTTSQEKENKSSQSAKGKHQILNCPEKAAQPPKKIAQRKTKDERPSAAQPWPQARPRSKATQGRADLRAAQHSGGRLGFAKAAAGPKIKGERGYSASFSGTIFRPKKMAKNVRPTAK